MSQQLNSDVLIVGAGPGGAATALFLARNGISSLLVDKSAFPRDKICGDALSGKVVEILNQLDPSIVKALDLEPIQVGSYGVTFVAPNGKPLRIPFKSANNGGSQPPGYISRRLDFDNFLIQLVRQEDRITFLEQVSFRNFKMKEDAVYARSVCGTVHVRSELVVAADGANSAFASKFGHLQVQKKHQAYGLRAYYRGVKGMDRENFIELHFLKEIIPGYFWIFPLPNGEANVGLGLRSDMLASRKVNLKRKLEEILQSNSAIRERFTHAELIGSVKLQSLPLGSVKRHISGSRFMLVGDAAALIDPFTGEGIGNALLSGKYAAEQAAHAIRAKDFRASFMSGYDKAVYQRLWNELSLSYKLQQLANVPWLFNFVVNKAVKSKTLSDTISCMFEDMDLRARLKDPTFYINLLFSNS